MNFGFSFEKYYLLQNSLQEHCRINDFKEKTEINFGIKYIIEGIIETPDKRNPLIRSVWIIENNTKKPILITAYPLK